MTTQAIEARVESLERGMRRWRRLATVLVVGLVVVACSQGEDEIPDVVVAREFQVVNKAGKYVVGMGAFEDSGAGGGGGNLRITNKAGTTIMEATENVNGGGAVFVNNQDGKLAAVMATNAAGNGVVKTANKAGKRVWASPPK